MPLSLKIITQVSNTIVITRVRQPSREPKLYGQDFCDISEWSDRESWEETTGDGDNEQGNSEMAAAESPEPSDVDSDFVVIGGDGAAKNKVAKIPLHYIFATDRIVVCPACCGLCA